MSESWTVYRGWPGLDPDRHIVIQRVEGVRKAMFHAATLEGIRLIIPLGLKPKADLQVKNGVTRVEVWTS